MWGFMIQYYVVSKKWTGLGTHTEQITFYRGNANGYTVYLEFAGKYTEEELKIKSISIGYDGKTDTFAVPCDIIDAMAYTAVPNECGNFSKLMEWTVA